MGFKSSIAQWLQSTAKNAVNDKTSQAIRQRLISATEQKDLHDNLVEVDVTAALQAGEWHKQSFLAGHPTQPENYWYTYQEARALTCWTNPAGIQVQIRERADGVESPRLFDIMNLAQAASTE